MSWGETKTNWTGNTDSRGVYSGDRFNVSDYNRIWNNVYWLKGQALSAGYDFTKSFTYEGTPISIDYTNQITPAEVNYSYSDFPVRNDFSKLFIHVMMLDYLTINTYNLTDQQAYLCFYNRVNYDNAVNTYLYYNPNTGISGIYFFLLHYTWLNFVEQTVQNVYDVLFPEN